MLPLEEKAKLHAHNLFSDLIKMLESHQSGFDFDQFDTKINQLLTDVRNSPGPESYVYKKLEKMAIKLPALVKRHVDQTDAEFNSREIPFTSSGETCEKTMQTMIEQVTEKKTFGDGKKVQLVFQGAEFVTDGSMQKKKDKDAMSISKIKEQCQTLAKDGQPVYVHMIVPDGGITTTDDTPKALNVGHLMTMKYDGTTWTTHDFDDFEKNILKLILSSDLAITRCGASSTAELVYALTPFIAVPLPNSIDNHQYLNAKYYKDKGYCSILEQDNFNTKNLFNLLEKSIRDKNKLEKIGENMKKDHGGDVYNNIEKEIKEFI